MNLPVGIRSLAVSFPNNIRTNEYWQNKYPDLFAQVKTRTARVPESVNVSIETHGVDIWSMEVKPYLSDPFRGNVERRVVGREESSLTLEYRAAKDALAAANLCTDEVELIIVASLFPEYIGIGNAAYLAQKLQLRCPAWNLESTCSSALIALQNAHALIQTGAYSNVLVVVSHIGSRTVNEKDSLSLSMGDGAGAFLVDVLQPNQGILGSKIIETRATCGAYLYEITTNAVNQPQICTRTGDKASMLAETAVDFVRTCCQGAIASAGVTLEEIDFFAFNTPTAWYASLCTRALGIDPQRTINLYPCYANIGPVLPIANLYHAAQTGKIREHDLVLVYTNGAAATAAATVMRWGDVALGLPPAPPISTTQQQESHYPLPVTGSISAKEGYTTNHYHLSREKFWETLPNQRQQILETYLIDILSDLLKRPIMQLNTQESFVYLVDSLIALELKNRIETDLQLQVSIAQFFQSSSVTQIAQFLLGKLALLELNSTESLSLEKQDDLEEIIL
ncbi:3-oxoacyl-ACP synthase [Nostocales cyanobacterium LEGE 11386]|nr:3-oxoacyl-ACP synthase [Nostocales cyanobacterium LEGE 11386]